MRKINKIIASMAWVLGMLSSCTSHNNHGQIVKGQEFYLGQSGAIPLDNKSYPIMLYNNSDDNIQISSENIKLLNIKLVDNKLASTVVDTTLCSTLPAHGECQLNVSLYNKMANGSGEFGLQIKGEKASNLSLIKSAKLKSKSDKDEPAGYETTTLISYFTPVASTRYEYHINDSSTTFHLNKVVNSNVNIPIHFNQHYKDMHLDHIGENMNVRLVGCDSTEAVAGSSCIVSVTVVGGKNFANRVNLTGKLVKQADSKNKKLKEDSSEIILSAPIVNTVNAVGNLLVGTATPSIIADGDHTITVNIANNGTGSITGFTPTVVESGSPLSITSTCGSTIAASGYCTLTVSAASSVISAVHHLQFAYSDGVNNKNIQYPIIIKPNQSSYASLDVSVMGNLVNTPVNYNSNVTITLTNSGDLTITGLSKQFVGGLPSMMDSTTTCGNTLMPSSSCQYVIKYNPTVAVNLNSFMTVFTGNYIDKDGSKTIQNYTDIQYSAIAQNNLLQYDFNVVLLNTTVSHATTKTITITNGGTNPVSAISPDFSSVTAQYQENYSVVSNPIGAAQDCSTLGLVLTQGQSCAITIQLLSTSAYPSADSGVITFNYTVNSQAGVDTLAYQSNVTNSNVNITASVYTSGNQSGMGSLNNPYNVNTINGNDFNIQVTYTNTGSADANNFATDGVWPIGYTLDDSTTTKYC
jgi:hypothetical protein